MHIRVNLSASQYLPLQAHAYRRERRGRLRVATGRLRRLMAKSGPTALRAIAAHCFGGQSPHT